MNTVNYNNAIEVQALVLEGDIRKRGTEKGIRHRSDSPSNSESLRKVKARLRSRDGMVDRITYNFPRTLIYPHYGAGAGQGGLVGSRWLDRYGNTKRTNPRSLGKAGTGNRTPKPFIDEALSGPDGVAKISEIAAIEIGAVVTGNIFVDKNNINRK